MVKFRFILLSELIIFTVWLLIRPTNIHCELIFLKNTIVFNPLLYSVQTYGLYYLVYTIYTMYNYIIIYNVYRTLKKLI